MYKNFKHSNEFVFSVAKRMDSRNVPDRKVSLYISDLIPLLPYSISIRFRTKSLFQKPSWENGSRRLFIVCW